MINHGNRGSANGMRAKTKATTNFVSTLQQDLQCWTCHYLLARPVQSTMPLIHSICDGFPTISKHPTFCFGECIQAKLSKHVKGHLPPPEVSTPDNMLQIDFEFLEERRQHKTQHSQLNKNLPANLLFYPSAHSEMDVAYTCWFQMCAPDAAGYSHSLAKNHICTLHDLLKKCGLTIGTIWNYKASELANSIEFHKIIRNNGYNIEVTTLDSSFFRLEL